MSALTFPRLVACGIAACLAAGLGHQARIRYSAPGSITRALSTTRFGASGNIITYYRRPGEAGSPTLVCEAGLLSTSMILATGGGPPAATISVVLYDRAGYPDSLRRCQEDYCLRESVDDLVQEVIRRDPIRPPRHVPVPAFLGGTCPPGGRAGAGAVRGVVLIDPTDHGSCCTPCAAGGVRSERSLTDEAGLLVGVVRRRPPDRQEEYHLASAEGVPRPPRTAPGGVDVFGWYADSGNGRLVFVHVGRRPATRSAVVPVTVLAAESTMRDIPAHKDLYEEYVASGSAGRSSPSRTQPSVRSSRESTARE